MHKCLGCQVEEVLRELRIPPSTDRNFKETEQARGLGGHGLSLCLGLSGEEKQPIEMHTE